MITSSDHPCEIDERWIVDWIAFGLAEIDTYLSRHAAFDRYLKETDR